MWRPNKQTVNSANFPAGRKKLSASDGDFNLTGHLQLPDYCQRVEVKNVLLPRSAPLAVAEAIVISQRMVRENEKLLLLKWDPSPVIRLDTSSMSAGIEEVFPVADAEFSPRKRRWPKLPPSISEKNGSGRLSSSLTSSSISSFSEACIPKPEMKREDDITGAKCIQSRKNAASKPQKVPKKVPREVRTSVDNEKVDPYLVRATTKNTTERSSGTEVHDGGSPAAADNNGNVASRTGNKKLTRKSMTQSKEKNSGELLPAFTVSEPKACVFSLKSKRSLERASISIMDRKRREECSQRAAAVGCEPKRNSAHDRSLLKPGGNSLKEEKATEICNSHVNKSAKMREVFISGPADAFREISIDRTSTGSTLACADERGDCIGDEQIDRPATEQSDSSFPVVMEDTNYSDTRVASHCNVKLSLPAGSLNADEIDRATNSSSSGKGDKSQPQKSLEIDTSPSKAEELISDDIPKIWSNPLHQESVSADMRNASLSSEKFSSILSYLGHVEESSMQDNFRFLPKRDLQGGASGYKGCQSPCTVLEHEDTVSVANSSFTTSLTNISCYQSGDGELGLNSATSLFEGVRKKMQDFRSKIATKESECAQLLRDVERLKAEKEQALSLIGRELETRAAEYKAAIQHHLALNEKMVKDKEALSEKCCNLAGTLQTVESKQKEIWIAGEKPRREAWKEKKIKEIKELTIKGLEPHIDGLNEKHRQEIKKLESRFADETQKKLEVKSIEHRQDICELRNRILKERDEILETERLAGLRRLNDVAEKYEQQAMDLRRKISSDMAVEIEKVEEARRKDKQTANEILSKAREDWNNRETAVKNSLEKSVQDAVSGKDAELRSLRSELDELKNDWQKDFDEKLGQSVQIKEDEFKARFMKERDEQIDMIIERMENEKEEAIAQHQQELLAKVETLMEEKLELMKKLKEVESKCAGLCKISLEAKQKAEMETANKDLQLESLGREMLCQADLIEQLKVQVQQEKKNLKEQEQRHELELAKQHELVLAAQLEAERSNSEIQQMRLRKAKELEEVEVHVRQAIENKDQTIAGLREQLLTAREQIRHTELLLQQEHVTFLADPD
ncbi:hypothetical protein R1sor_021427 [Riccia sorocarpa]|uniref:Uncharacterized protein n=1 Tax=Riccia sorocarpa TaxID=122646 RepID=A0ABD3GIH1_9MARC